MERENNARIELLNKRIDTLIGDLADLRSFLLEDFCSTSDSEQKENRMDQVLREETGKKCLLLSCLLFSDEELSYFVKALAEHILHSGTTGSVVQGTVYSALPLDDEELHRLEKQTSMFLKKQVSLINVIDESLIGGFLISVDDKLLDASVKKKIEDMRIRIETGTEGGNLL